MTLYRPLTPEEQEKAMEVISMTVACDCCSFAMSRPFRGETCSEWRSSMQGVPMPGCSYCEAYDLLKAVDPTSSALRRG